MSFSTDQYRAYMRRLATEHIRVKHTEKRPRFFELGLKEILEGGISDLPPQEELFLALEPIEWNLRNQDSDFPKRVWGGAFILAASCAPQDHKMIDRVQDASEKVGLQFMQRMYQDAELAFQGEDADEASNLIEFDEGSVEVMAVGPIITNCFGMRFTYNYVDEVNLLETNDDVWQ
jgi:hypothetical protein